MRTVAIIGGGISGLICVKCCLDGGLTPICFEMTGDIGGLWNYDSNAVDGKASVMKSTVINTSKEFMAFSDLPPPDDFPNYMHNTKLLAYFRMYAERFHLIEHIRFRRRVTRIEPAEDYEQSGAWTVISVDAQTNDPSTQSVEKYDAVMLATGHHAKPKWAHFPGLDQYKGKHFHQSV
jgi:dimethylaniline monooxygenase (N-oxide forming)